MKTGTLFILALAFLAGGFCGAQQGAPAAAVQKTEASALEMRLAGEILNQLKSADKEAVETFLEKPANRVALAQWHLAHAERLAGTLGIEQAMASAPAFFGQLSDNANWWERLAYSGECTHPARSFEILADLAREYPKLAQEPMPLAIASATAMEWGKTRWDAALARERARFYIENDRENRFHTGFRTLPFWQLRVVCGCKADNTHGSAESLRWALENVHLPAEQYTGACWQANYLAHNLFHDSIHGPHYYAPYTEVYGDNAVQRTRDVGGVCGSLSHFGAFAALGNGVPAMTAGEPGHCAYIVLVNGRWTPAYSLSWQRGLHWQVWKGIHCYSSLPMANELYGEGQSRQTALSNACHTLGLLHAQQGDRRRELALPLLRAAVKVQPLNYPAWRDYAACVREQAGGSARAKVWDRVNRDVCQWLAPRYPEMAAELLKGHVYPHASVLSARQLPAAFALFWKSLQGMGPDRWAIEALGNKQLDMLKERQKNADKKQQEQTAANLYGLVLGATANNAAYAPAILAWGNGMASGMDAAMQQRFLKMTLNALSKSSKGSMDDAARDRMLGQAILGAERMRDRSSFQALGKLLSANYREPKSRLPEWEPFPGKLVSQGGLLYTSSTCQHDDPAAHWGVLEPTGGRFHTGGDTDAWAAVQLPKTSVIYGVVTIAPQGNLWRLTNMKVQYSETGRDDDWHDAGALPNPTGQRVNRLDLQELKPRARYIRIVRPGGPQLFHLFGIFVYGKPAA